MNFEITNVEEITWKVFKPEGRFQCFICQEREAVYRVGTRYGTVEGTVCVCGECCGKDTIEEFWERKVPVAGKVSSEKKDLVRYIELLAKRRIPGLERLMMEELQVVKQIALEAGCWKDLKERGNGR